MKLIFPSPKPFFLLAALCLGSTGFAQTHDGGDVGDGSNPDGRLPKVKVHTFQCQAPREFGLGTLQTFTFKTVNTEKGKIAFHQFSDHPTFGDDWLKVEPNEHAPLSRVNHVKRTLTGIELKGSEDGIHAFKITLSKKSKYRQGTLEAKPAKDAARDEKPEVKMGRFEIRCDVKESIEEHYDE